LSTAVSVAAGPYVHLAALGAGDGEDGLRVERVVMEPGRIFPRMLQEAPWDVAEMSLATAYILAARGDRRFVPIPVFPSRTFRHSSLYVAASSGVRTAGDLRGRRIGVLRYAMTTAVWVREMLRIQYGVPPETLQWVVGEDSPHPPGTKPSIVEGASALERLALEGGIDCLISGRTPQAAEEGRLRRLFGDFAAEEKAYFATTGVFPIMHVMVVRRALAEKNPQLVARLMARFESAKRVAEEGLRNSDLSLYPLPWLPAYVHDARRAFGGGELWPYGIEANRAILAAFGRALATEGLASRALDPEEVFFTAEAFAGARSV
jgi:4,5-dihydroxyphthalate decarboxylase